jgi:hypothetical protein
MSVQAYTNKRRILAEASLRKTQYPGSIGLNNNPLYATINCNSDFTNLVYLINRCCVKNTIHPIIVIPPTLGSGGASTNPTSSLSGGDASTSSTTILSGGDAGRNPYVQSPSSTLLSGKARGGDAFSQPSKSLIGGGASTNATTTASGGDAWSR